MVIQFPLSALMKLLTRLGEPRLMAATQSSLRSRPAVKLQSVGLPADFQVYSVTQSPIRDGAGAHAKIGVKESHFRSLFCAAMVAAGCGLGGSVHAAGVAPSVASSGLWQHDNLYVWGLAPFDEKHRTPEERARLLESLGLKTIAYNWRDSDVPLFDEQIEAFKRHHITIMAWSIYDADELSATTKWEDRIVVSPKVLLGLGGPAPHAPTVRMLLETFRRHDIHPELWLVQPMRNDSPAPSSKKLSAAEDKELGLRIIRADFPDTPKKQALRVREEADRVNALVKLTAPYGVKIELYNHNYWFGMLENELAVIQRLRDLGVFDVGIAYNFDHARDGLHDDSADFAKLWNEVKRYVVAVNITAMRGPEGTHPLAYPSQGAGELEMMRVIQESGWQGPVGLVAKNGGDAEITIRNYLIGLDWLGAELKQRGSGGPPPFEPLQVKRVP